jgi:hypothetical protein
MIKGHKHLHWTSYIIFLPLNSIYILHTDIDTYIRIFIIGDFNIHIKIIPYIHGLELIFTDWTDTEDIYIYIYTVVLQKAEESSTTEQNRTEHWSYCF